MNEQDELWMELTEPQGIRGRLNHAIFALKRDFPVFMKGMKEGFLGGLLLLWGPPVLLWFAFKSAYDTFAKTVVPMLNKYSELK